MLLRPGIRRLIGLRALVAILLTSIVAPFLTSFLALFAGVIG